MKMAIKDITKNHSILNTINSFVNGLSKRKDVVIVLTDKTNLFILKKNDLYSRLVTMHLAEDTIKTDLKCINYIHDEALKLCNMSQYILSRTQRHQKYTVNMHTILTICPSSQGSQR